MIAFARRTALAIAGVLIVVVGCGSDRTAGPPHGPQTAASEIFRFHTGFWANLHQVLIHESLLPKPGFDGPKSLAHQSVAPTSELSAEEAGPWRNALGDYDHRFTTRNTFTDENMAAVRALTSVASEPTLTTATLPPELKTLLERAAPGYRAHFWAEHERGDRAYIEAIRPLIAQHGEWLKKRLVALYETPWPSAPVDVEVAPVVPPFGASTIGEPPYEGVHRPLIIVSSKDPGNSGESGLEMIFHESSHLLVDRVQAKLEASAKRQGKSPPGNLWHFVLFYTAGHVTKERLGPSYVPYAERPETRIFTGDLAGVFAIISRAWQPYLDGKAMLDPAIDALVASF